MPRPVVIATVAVVAALLWLGAIASGQTGDASSAAPAQQEQATVLAAQDDTPRRAGAAVDRSSRAILGTERFGIVDGLALHLPHVAPITVAFHEATRPESLPIDPTGALEVNENASKYVAPADGEGPSYRILTSRGRGRPATSAVDIVLPEGSRALAPVDGTVVEVRQYALSGAVSDWRVVIEPAGRKDLQVVLIHLHEPQVKVGDAVEAGRSPLAVVRLLPFVSHVDYVVGETHPHVHVEIKPASVARPIDPNLPAVPSTGDEDVAARD